ncbi:hypothetical protein MSAS_53600 [Mycobacterium saskatchewanense]|uniref:hypothetical protein n=1 Tax=Mycobacterium saskatchewanense TaxID=220927 RepID=UPI001153FD12|nr:hypothetical protein [Mycobacterium saskatchewanense]BBX66186.1 hypothetical protein MSAS_53600 [Mycobacterium saskatchewanense]
MLTVATLLLIGKIALVAFLIVGCSVLLVTYLRKRPPGGPGPQSDPNAEGYLGLYRGRVAPTPKPESVVEQSLSEPPGDDPEGGAPRRWL